ncbi:MAG: threonylcarbamoyl-AMP synthase [Bacteroidales bacterium]|nr:threonylcarbamoyl-AMP synthase [Bacteroidales bacterium]
MEQELKNALRVIEKGGTILYPTDTIWGIGGDATKAKVIDKIYAIKNRAESKNMIVLLADFDQLKHYASEIPPIAEDLIKMIERPLTIIYNGAKNIAPNLIASDGTIAIRIVNHTFCRTLIQRMGKPLISTSANLSGSPSPLFFGQIPEHIKKSVDYIVNLDQHLKAEHKASTIIKLEKSGIYTVIRE